MKLNLICFYTVGEFELQPKRQLGIHKKKFSNYHQGIHLEFPLYLFNWVFFVNKSKLTMVLMFGVKGFLSSKKIATSEIRSNNPWFMNPMFSLLSYSGMWLLGESAKRL